MIRTKIVNVDGEEYIQCDLCPATGVKEGTYIFWDRQEFKTRVASSRDTAICMAIIGVYDTKDHHVCGGCFNRKLAPYINSIRCKK